MPPRSLIFALLATGCSLDASEKTACRDNEDCVGDRSCVLGTCLEDPVWGCLTQARERDTGLPPLRFTVVLVDAITDAPLPGGTVRICERTDVGCSTPKAVLNASTDGSVEIQAEDQYFEVEAAGYVPRIAMSVDSFDRLDDGRAFDFDMWPADDLARVLTDGGIPAVPDRGMLEVSTRDCGLEGAADVSIDFDLNAPPTVVRYPINDVLSTTAIATDFETAAALAFNVVPGARSVTGTVIIQDRPLGPTRSVLVRPGWLSHLTLAPDGLGTATLLEE